MILQAIREVTTKAVRYVLSVCHELDLFVKKLILKKYRLIFFKGVIITFSLLLFFRPSNAFACEINNTNKKRSWSDFMKVILLKNRFSFIPLF